MTSFVLLLLLELMWDKSCALTRFINVLSWAKLLLMIHPICWVLSSRMIPVILEILLMNWISHSLHGLEWFISRRERTETKLDWWAIGKFYLCLRPSCFFLTISIILITGDDGYDGYLPQSGVRLFLANFPENDHNWICLSKHSVEPETVCRCWLCRINSYRCEQYSRKLLYCFEARDQHTQ